MTDPRVTQASLRAYLRAFLHGLHGKSRESFETFIVCPRCASEIKIRPLAIDFDPDAVLCSYCGLRSEPSEVDG